MNLARGEPNPEPPQRVRDALQRLVATEAEARRIIDEAQDRGAQVVAAAKRKARELAAAAAALAEREADDLAAAAVAGAARDRVQRVEAARAEIEGRLRLDGEALRRAADLVLRSVLGRGGAP